MSSTTAEKPVKRLSVAIIVIGALMLVMGCAVYGFVSFELSSQNITVSTKTKDDPGALAGKPVNGPFDALAQVMAIQTHLDAETGGKSFAELGNVATSNGVTYDADVTADKSTDGQAHSEGDPLSEEDAATYAARSSAQTASFLQASLFTSVLAFGVSIFIAIMGVVIGLIGINMFIVAKRLAVPQVAAPKTA